MSLFDELREIFNQFDRELTSGAIEWKKIKGPEHLIDRLMESLDNPSGNLQTTDDAEIELLAGADFDLEDAFAKRDFRKLTITRPTHHYTDGISALADVVFDQVGLGTYGEFAADKIISWLLHKDNRVSFGSNASEIVHFPELLQKTNALERIFHEGWRTNTTASKVTLSDGSTYDIPGEKDLFVKVIEISTSDLQRKDAGNPLPYNMYDALYGMARTKKLRPGEELQVYTLTDGKIYQELTTAPEGKVSALLLRVKGKDLANQLLVNDLGVAPKQLGLSSRETAR